ncbi:AraC family transcriptional regulator [Pedobacter lusitanus]|uniref:AraC family transcriptional regulator n=1 Tax=Pedobacter lusitanus TaxID=1503925 RepID=UPI000697AD46|nr:helix-turn-helix transcriptional regulator [Pedobacter lusitanus]
MKTIPLHILQDRTSSGLQIKKFRREDHQVDDPDTDGAHRDDHYIFFLLETGSGNLMIDFKEVQLLGGMLYYILPTQVHHRIRTVNVDGWYLAVDIALIPQECRNVFERGLLLQRPYELNEVQLKQCNNLMTLFHEKYKESDTDPFYAPVIHALLQSFLAIVAGHYNEHSGLNLKVSRRAEISGQFKNLLTTELRSIKSPADYASRLNVSESYLNEVLKKTTGFPVSYWIHQEVMTEAKRLLYYSRLTVKEIAHELGYADHSYFSRLFRKQSGTTAIAFRDQYRK